MVHRLSLALAAMWLNGFNDNLPGFPRAPCKYSQCRKSYLPEKQPGVPIDPVKPLQGPFGTGMSGPIFGLCPGGREWIKEASGDPFTGRDWVRAPPDLPKHLDDTDDVMRNLAIKKIDAFSGIGHGFFFWNFRTDLYEPEWSYMEALERGWIPRGNLNREEISTACVREDSGTAFKCVLKRRLIDEGLRNALAYILNVENKTTTEERQVILNLTGQSLRAATEQAVGDFFDKHRHSGATCDFGGIAFLVERNTTLQPQTGVAGLTDDEYYTINVKHVRPTWALATGAVIMMLVGILIGFIMAMRCSVRFNQSVRRSSIMKPICQSRSKILRSSLALPDLDYEELEH